MMKLYRENGIYKLKAHWLLKVKIISERARHEVN